MDRLEEIILEHTRLAKEFIDLPVNGGDTPEDAAAIERRKEEIKDRIEELKSERMNLYGK